MFIQTKKNILQLISYTSKISLLRCKKMFALQIMQKALKRCSDLTPPKKDLMHVFDIMNAPGTRYFHICCSKYCN